MHRIWRRTLAGGRSLYPGTRPRLQTAPGSRSTRSQSCSLFLFTRETERQTALKFGQSSCRVLRVVRPCQIHGQNLHYEKILKIESHATQRSKCSKRTKKATIGDHYIKEVACASIRRLKHVMNRNRLAKRRYLRCRTGSLSHMRKIVHTIYVQKNH